MYFQLLRGQYEDANGVRHEAQYTFDAKGEIIDKQLPIIETNVDLVKSFGTEKFRRISEEEQTHLNLLPEERTLGTAVADAPVPDASGKFIGKNITGFYPEAKKAGLQVFVRDGNFSVVDAGTGSVLNTEGSLKKEEVKPFIKKYLEG